MVTYWLAFIQVAVFKLPLSWTSSKGSNLKTKNVTHLNQNIT